MNKSDQESTKSDPEESDTVTKKPQKRSKKNKNENKEFESKAEYKIEKTFRSNMFIATITDCDEWRNDLMQTMESNECGLMRTKKALIIRDLKESNSETFSSWTKLVNSMLNDFLSHFKMEVFTYEKSDKEHLESFIKKINTFNSIVTQLHHIRKEHEKKIYLVGSRQIIEDFLSINSADSFINSIKQNENNLIDDKLVVFKEIAIPDEKPFEFYPLIYSTIPFLKTKFNLADFNVDRKDKLIILTGTKENVELAARVLVDSFEKTRNSLLLKLNLDLNKCKNLQNLIKESLKELVSVYLFKLNLKNDDETKSCEIFITYFSNCPELNSKGNHVYNAVKDVFTNVLNYAEVEFKNQVKNFLLTSKWKNFEQAHLNKTICGNSLLHYVSDDESIEANKIVLFGRKDLVDSAKNLINEFISKNQLITKTIRLGENDVSLVWISV